IYRLQQRYPAAERQFRLLRRARADLHFGLGLPFLMRRWLALLHRWAGGLAGLLLAVLGLSGTILLWEESWIELPGADDALRVDPAASGAAVEAALAIDPGLSRITFADHDMGLH